MTTDQVNRPKLNPVTWAALSVYQTTPEGAALGGLGEVVRLAAPIKRLQGVALATAEGLGVLSRDGQLTPSGLSAARLAVKRLGLSSEATP